MIRFVLRGLSIISLAVGVIFAVLDGARSVGASEFVAKPLLEIWMQGSAQSLDDAKHFAVHYIGLSGWENVVVPFLDLPGWVVFGLIALIFYALSYKRERKLGRFAAR
ncbi:hypothetical protein ACFOLL_00675 [Falsochrobactrum ovis]|uniref:Uncharacterized protein n=1 Tax=Falsochrobactrum ovis TaxID=1293442 RepID=A0A364JUD2_9HYPH|nr:hypothetical protein [Falsochrobactrum ovis]RAK28107.1 hypothetical protein C7374_1077 [Falsochrobactrum ovis]